MISAVADDVTLEWSDNLKRGYAPKDDTRKKFVEIVNAMPTCTDEHVMHHLA